MSPIYDFKCDKCGKEKSDVMCRLEEVVECDICKEPMVRLCNCTNFRLTYNNKTDMCDWQGNSSMYWKDVKAARERGEDVKGADE